MAKQTATKGKVQRHTAAPLPKYQKPYQEFVKQVRPGMRVRIERRTMTEDYHWAMRTEEGVVKEMATNCVVFVGPAVPGTPYYTIHDWEILDAA